MVAVGPGIGGRLEQLTRCDGRQGYELQVTRATGANVTECQNLTIPDTRASGLCDFTPFWDFPANASYQGVDPTVRAGSPDGPACDWWAYWSGHEQYGFWAHGDTPVRSGKVFTTVPGYLLWNITWTNFTSAEPPAAVFTPPANLPTCSRPTKAERSSRGLSAGQGAGEGVAARALRPGLAHDGRAVASGEAQPYFPVFHVRPPAGHVNDPNFPFRNPRTGHVHLFMQYCPLGPCTGQGKPSGRPNNYQAATQFYSTDLVTWRWTGPKAGVLPDGKNESDSDCPDNQGVYSGSTTLVDGVPHLAYPGVHLNPRPWRDGERYVAMSQCVATPADPADPELKVWKKRTIITSEQIPHGVRQHFHDDSEAFRGRDNRWWMFMGTASCPGNLPATGDCPFPDPAVNKTYGVNYLFSSADFLSWRPEHSLYNTTSKFVSCPEFYSLPGMASDQYVYHEMNGMNKIGTFDPDTVTFQPDGRSIGRYDNHDGTASKSFWDEKTGRRIMWSWLRGAFPCNNAQNIPCDSMQSVPRDVTYNAALDTLIINPIAEVAQLRTGPAMAALKGTPLGPQPSAVPGAHGTALDVLLNFSCPPSAPAGASCGGAVQVRVTDDATGYIEVAVSASYAPGQSADVTVTSYGALQAVAKTVPEGERFWNNTNFRHGDIADVALPENTTSSEGAAECQHHCDSLEGCQAWVFVRKGYNHGPRCALKGNGSCLDVEDACAGCEMNGRCFCEAGLASNSTQPPPCSPPPSAMSFAVPLAPNETFGGRFPVRILVDRPVIEVYAMDGRAIASFAHLPKDPQASGVRLRRLATATVPVECDVQVFAMGSAYAS